MKKVFLIVYAFILVQLFYGCKKPDEPIRTITDSLTIEKITYPLTYDSKLNILYDSTFIVNPGITYSIAADLPNKTSIKIVCKPSDGKNWGAAGFFISEAVGYTVHNFHPDSLVFEAEGNSKTVNIPIMFGAALATAKTSIVFNIYENDSVSPIRIKTVKSY